MILTMRRSMVVALAAALPFFANGACSNDDGEAASGKVDVVAGFYPVAEIAAAVGGDSVTVTNVTPAGAEPHDIELTSSQVDHIEDADLVIYVGGGFQPAVERAVERRPRELGSTNVDILQTTPREQLKGKDPHVWLAPMLLRSTVIRMRNALGQVDPDNAMDYTERANAYEQQLVALNEEFQTGLADCERRVIVTAHEAFHYLARAYGLEQKAISGLSPAAEPEGDRLSELADEIQRTGATTVFTEQLVSSKTADALAREAGVTTAVLDPIEGLTDAKRKAGATYFTVMRENLQALRTALGCK